MLNLPASQDFEPCMLWVYKRNMLVNKIAGEHVAFLDDIRVLSFSVENCWQCGRKLSSNIQFLGIQYSSRKKKPLSLTLGTWDRCIARSEKVMVYRLVTQEKWEKVKHYLLSLEKVIGTCEHPKTLNHKFLERIRGFFNHLAMTYDIMFPFLKGFHNTMYGWRDDRDEGGWKEERDAWKHVLDYCLDKEDLIEGEHDKLIASRQIKRKPPMRSCLPLAYLMIWKC